jgi:HlyD family secretion protein
VLLAPSSAFRFTPPQPQAERSFSIRDLFMPRFRGPGMRRGAAGNAGGDGGRTVYVLERGKPPERRTVEVGATSGDMTEIVSGLSEGDRVIIGIMREGARSR